MRVHYLVESVGDHYALLITDSIVLQSPRKRMFQFEAMWMRRDECRDIIRTTWNDSVNLYSPNGMVAGLKQCANNLSRWNREVFGRVPRQIQNHTTLQSLLLKKRSTTYTKQNAIHLHHLPYLHHHQDHPQHR